MRLIYRAALALLYVLDFLFEWVWALMTAALCAALVGVGVRIGEPWEGVKLAALLVLIVGLAYRHGQLRGRGERL